MFVLDKDKNRIKKIKSCTFSELKMEAAFKKPLQKNKMEFKTEFND